MRMGALCEECEGHWEYPKCRVKLSHYLSVDVGSGTGRTHTPTVDRGQGLVAVNRIYGGSLVARCRDRGPAVAGG